MSKSQNGTPERAKSSASIEGGFAVSLDERKVEEFMQSGDLSSASELHHFESIAEKIERIIKESNNKSLVACSFPEDRMLRDFAVLQIAHIISKQNKEVFIVDSDFLSPGLSGIVEDIEEHGFLDLLLYGSSLKSISKDIGIEGVKVVGPGSFPVSKTIPFAMKEFEKISAFLAEKSDVVIYCSTIYTDEGKLNPLCREINQVVMFCQIDRLQDGELKKHIESIKEEEVAHAEIVCFCREEEVAASAPGEEVEVAGGEAHGEEPQYIEKTSEVAIEAKEGHSRLPWIITSVVAILIVAFVAWWFLNSRAIKQNEAKQKLTEVVQKKSESRTAAMGKRGKGEEALPAVADTSSIGESKEKGITPSAEERKAREVEIGNKAMPSVIEEQGYYYTVHVASFKDTLRAHREVRYLEKNGFDAFIVRIVVKDRLWFRVLVGKFATKDEAEKTKLNLLELKRIGYARIIKQEKSK